MSPAHHQGRGKFAARLERIPRERVVLPASAPDVPPPPPPLSGIEIIRDQFQRSADHAPEDRVRVLDHAAGGAVLFSGTEAELKRLRKALAPAKKAPAKKAPAKKKGR